MKDRGSLANKMECLSHGLLFENLSRDQLARLAAMCTECLYRKGEAIFAEGKKAEGFYVVCSGRVKVYKVSFDGREQILHLFDAGNILGEVPVFTGGTYPAHAEALTDVEALFIPRNAFIRFIQEDNSLALSMLAVLSRKLRHFTALVETLSLKEVPGRLASYLLYLNERNPSADTVDLDVTKTHLAAVLGTIPETLSRIFSKMVAAGLIEVQGRSILIKDREGLAALSQGEKLG
ncbi:Crp/Fnr family transcriptional regulator [Desulfosoma caldarium]|uniref:CRP/FNR family transcriptional regulator n=1 Tax=Desulfosoma caldarium TaxID=610254 RepID=A0A3N1UN68_9BACT|nr:Crp/Fnr family transcriptional regulator [Desulfosoma caldarium]ROQ90170.1 CRP/FNR family transcriptional regulator [Desulfosoma caldarium]